MRRIQRCVAFRVISAYRTVSLKAAAILTGQVPLDILAREYEKMYVRICALREEGIVLTDRQRLCLKNLEKTASIKEWKQRLIKGADRLPGATVRDCLVPLLGEWLAKKKRLGLTFRTIQIISERGF